MWIDEAPSIVHVLRRRADEHGGLPAYTFLDGESEAARVTYAELDRRVRSLAAALQAAATPGERALLLYPPTLDYLVAFWACLYAGIVAVPAYPPEPHRRDQGIARLRTLAASARPALVMTTGELGASLAALGERAPELMAVRIFATDAAAADVGAANEWRERLPPRDGLAFLQYSSGSTAEPKGVMLSHGNLVHNERMIRDAFGHDAGTTVVSWLPLYHDMGLIGNALQPIFVGGHSILMSPLAFLKRPLRWLQAISKYRATTSGAPNFGYDLALAKSSPEAIETLDLRAWSVAYCGSEPIRARTVAAFAARFAPAGFRAEAFYPCYGLAEATLLVTGGTRLQAPIVRRFDARALEHGLATRAEADGGVALVGCGRAHLDEEVAIVDPETRQRLPPGRVGEIWVRGPNVANGYWSNAAATAAGFGATPSPAPGGGDDDASSGAHGRAYLRTGDLGFEEGGTAMGEDRQLFIAGRIKDVIILAGRNHHPQDIEQTVEACHPVLRASSSAALSVEDAEQREQLGIAAEVEKDGDSASVVLAIRRAVNERHGIAVAQVALLRRGALPKTSSGKVRRGACRQALAAGSLEALHTWRAPTLADGEPTA
jgi:acyl-CoA synthetase (AMP-forming)/AMP-acid ligase II